MAGRINALRVALMAGTVLGMSQPVLASEDSLEDRIAALESMVRELKSELDDERSRTDQKIERIAARPAAMPAARATGGDKGFAMGDVNVEVGGFVDADAHVTSLSDGAISANSIARDFYIPGVTPIGGQETTATDLTAEATRFFLKATKQVDGETVTGYIEMDFLGSLQGNQRVSNSVSPRLRRAYIDYNGWRIGQEWSTFQNTSAIPESASFLVASDGMVFMRQPMVRYTNGNWQFAIENPDATITDTSGARIEADSNLLPDLVGRYNFTGDFGNVSIAALGRQLRLDIGAVEEDTYGVGVSASGRIKVGERNDIRFNLIAGEGMGRYVGLNAANGAAINPANGELEAVPSYGGYVAYRQPFGKTARLSLGYSGLFIDNPDFVPNSATKQVQSAFVAVLWDVAPKITMGAELMAGVRENEAGQDGNITRATFSTKFAF